MMENSTPHIVLECSGLTCVGTAQLKELINSTQLAQACGGDLKYAGVLPTIQQLAGLVARGDLMQFYDNVPQALQAFRRSVPSLSH